jgi:hypothetical protein
MFLRFITTVLKGLKNQVNGIKNHWFFHENRRFFEGFEISRKGRGGVFFHSDFVQNRNIWFSGSVTGTGGSLRIQITAQHWLLCSEYRIRT